MHRILYVGLAAVCIMQFASIFFFFQDQETSDESTFSATLTAYKVNGDRVTGFLKQQNTIYFSYTLSSKEEKFFWENNFLIGTNVAVEGTWASLNERAHQYAFSMENYLRSQNSNGLFEVATIDFLNREKSVQFFLLKQRHNFAKFIDDLLPPILAQEAKALLIGLQDGLDEEVERAYQKLGITHLFAISGMHVVFLSFLFFEAAILLRVRRETAQFLVCVLLPIYGVLAGGTPSIWRAIAVVEIIQLFKLLKRPLAIDDALSLSAILFLLLSPHYLFQVGFQLSYLATYSLIYSSFILKKCSSFISLNFYMSVICQLFVLPILALYFYEISLSSFVANIVFVPLYTWVIVPLNVVLVLLGVFCRPLAYGLIYVYEPLRILLNEAILWAKDLPYQMWIIGKPNLLLLIILYLFILGLFICWSKRKRVALLVVVVLLVSSVEIPKYIQSNVLITFINVGQGDCILIELPYKRQTILIDSGGLLRFQEADWKQRDTVYEVGKQVVVPYLKGKGISKIDKFILTHADADHIEGAEEILEEIRVKEIHITPSSLYEESMNDLRKIALKKQIPIIEQLGGNSWSLGEATFTYLLPDDVVYEGNNDSLVLLFTYKHFTALFTGDLEEQGERTLIAKYAEQIKQLSLLKAGHHGSKTSSSESFINRTNPEVVVFTAGKNNRFGHPAKEVVERIQKKGIPFLTIGEVGTIQVEVNKNTFTIRKQ